MSPKQAFFSCDWGTSRFRLRLIRRDTEEVLSEIVNEDGVAEIASRCGTDRSGEFQRVFLQATSQLDSRHADVSASHAVISGMASSTMGWKEVPYAALPVWITVKSFVYETLDLPGMTTMLISGVSAPEDVLRGEETELLGLCSLLPELRETSTATLILPGTHSKHLKLNSGRLIGFETFMTGELFGHLQNLPTLKTCFDGQQDHLGFERGLKDFFDLGLMRSLFKIRARKALGNGAEGRAYLSGLLIAAELENLEREGPVWIAAPAPISGNYAKAAAFFGIENILFVQEDVMQKSIVRAHHLFLSEIT